MRALPERRGFCREQDNSNASSRRTCQGAAVRTERCFFSAFSFRDFHRCYVEHLREIGAPILETAAENWRRLRDLSQTVSRICRKAEVPHAKRNVFSRACAM